MSILSTRSAGAALLGCLWVRNEFFMEWYFYILGIGLFLILYSVSINWFHLRETNQLYSAYLEYIEKRNPEFVENKHRILELFNKAGIQDKILPTSTFVGMGIKNYKYSVHDNLEMVSEDTKRVVNYSFREAIGVFRSRIKNAINPLYWIEFIFFLPKVVLNYLGVSAESIIVKFAQIIYWLAGVLFAVFKSYIIDYLREIFRISK